MNAPAPSLAELLAHSHDYRTRQWSDEVAIMEANGRCMQLARGIEAIGKLLGTHHDVDENTAAGIGCMLQEVGGLMTQLTGIVEESRVSIHERAGTQD